MALALSLRFDARTSEAVSGLWVALAEAGVSRDMLELGYPPHVTLLVLDDEAFAEQLQAGLAALVRLVPPELRLGEVRQFPDTSVVWIECLGELDSLHQAAAELVPLESIRPHYRPGAWTPHFTLQVVGDAVRAMALSQACWTPGGTARASKLEVARFAPVKALGSVNVG